MTGGRINVAEPLPKKGDPIELVRYFLSEDQWASEIVAGRFVSATASLIRVDQAPGSRALDRSQWKVCIGPAEAQKHRRAPSPDPSAQLCPAVRTQTKDDPLVDDIRTVDRRGRRREGTRTCTSCGVRVSVAQTMTAGRPSSAWWYAPHLSPNSVEVAG